MRGAGGCIQAGVAAPRAAAQEVQVTGPLAGAPAVRHMREYRLRRVQLQPFFGTTLRNEYSRAMLFGLQAHYGITDWLGVGVVGAWGGVHLDTDLTRDIKHLGVTSERNRLSLPQREKFAKQIGEIQWFAAAQVDFAPLRGKIAAFQKLFVDTDLFLFGGVALVGLEERANVARADCDAESDPIACLDASQLARSSRVAVAATFGAGINLYFTETVGLALEWRALPFKWNTSGTDESGGPKGTPDDVIDSHDRKRHFNQMMTLGVVVSLPGHAHISE